MTPENFRIFLHPQRSFDLNTYRANFNACMKVCDARHVPGMLISSSGADFFDPWIMAQYYLQNTTNTSAVIAINPVYTHPFTAARMIVSLSELYQRKLFINFVIGSDLMDLHSIGDRLSHDERYRRMDEFIHIFKGLVFSRKKLTYKGLYYEVENISLLSKMKEDFLPEFWVAGHSDAGVALAKKYDVLNLQMIQEENPAKDISDKMYAFSIVCRDAIEEIETVISTQFPKDRFGEILFQQTLAHTDSDWKQKIYQKIVKGEMNKLFRAESVKYKYTADPCLAGSKNEMKEFFSPLIESGLKNVLITYHNEVDLNNFGEVISLIK
jgi:alkanesulfonate monooxygenase